MKYYNRLENGPIDEIDAAVFSGDIFFTQGPRKAFREMMARWEKQLKEYETFEEPENEILNSK